MVNVEKCWEILKPAWRTCIQYTTNSSPVCLSCWKLVPIFPALRFTCCLSLWSINFIDTPVSTWWIDRILSGDATTDLMKLVESETMQTGDKILVNKSTLISCYFSVLSYSVSIVYIIALKKCFHPDIWICHIHRLFDSQNNNRGGYNVGKLYYYEGSVLSIEW